jgi:outer membrane protein OmpA-like peptidoglycan-associated protein
MKVTLRFLMAAILMMASAIVNAQIDMNKVVNRSVKKAERNVENRVERRIDKGVDKSLDAVEDGIDNTVNGDGKDDKKKEKSNNEKSDNKNDKGKTDNTQDKQSQDTQPAPQEPEKPKPVLEWAKYDFVPGTEIIFEDNQEGELNGEFPSKWDLAGGAFENAGFGGENVIMVRKCNINANEGIVPLLKNSKEDYLPEEFTVEFDAYYEKPNQTYRIYLFDAKNQKQLDPNNNVNKRFYLRFNQNSADGKEISTGYYPGFSNANVSSSKPGWRHISISFNKRALKAYIDDARVMNIPNLDINPVGITLGFHNPSGTLNGFVKNIRIAKGAVPLYDKVLSDGKFVTTGIKFDVNKASIRAESMGTINYVVKMMQDNPTLRFSVEGHTDSDGEDASNLKLSEARAKAVMDKLVELGIAKDRLTSKGLGESKPMAANDSPEGKAQNRRVEFVKF